MEDDLGIARGRQWRSDAFLQCVDQAGAIVHTRVRGNPDVAVEGARRGFSLTLRTCPQHRVTETDVDIGPYALTIRPA